MSYADELPIDMSHPAVRDYIALTRLQVLTPLSLLINIASLVVCSTVSRPTLRKISREFYVTSITPNTGMIGTFVIVVFAAQIGYCVLLVLARKAETKKTLVKGVGISLVFANWIMALWALLTIFEFWIPATIFLGLLVFSLVYANLVLLIYHPPVHSRPFDTLFIHVPVRLFLVLPLNILFWQSLFITLGWSWDRGSPQDYSKFSLSGFLVVILTNVFAMLVTVLHKDFVWCIGTAWLDAAIFSAGPKSASVGTTSFVFMIALPIALVLAYVWTWINNRGSQGAIVLPDEETVVVPEEPNHT